MKLDISTHKSERLSRKTMRKVGALCLLLLSSAIPIQCFGQSIYERIPNQAERLCVLLLGYNGTNIQGFGSASLFYVPVSTNSGGTAVVCAVTAQHNLTNMLTCKPFDGLYLKINMPADAKPRYVKVPLKHDVPRSYWTSPSGLDLALIPLPPEVIDGANMSTVKEDGIVTPEKLSEADIVPGLIVQVICLQPDYWSYPADYLVPETTPTMRVGHLSRLGFQKTSTGIQVRPHVIDVHSSPGNSGASVIVWVPRKDASVSAPMLLGIVQGFYEETGSYKPYRIPLTQTSEQTNTIAFVSANNATTNRFALALRTLANPNLTLVIPVHELVNLKDSKEFQLAAALMGLNRSQYEQSTFLPIADNAKK